MDTFEFWLYGADLKFKFQDFLCVGGSPRVTTDFSPIIRNLYTSNTPTSGLILANENFINRFGYVDL